MYIDSIKIGNTIKYIQNVAYLSELPVANENSADLVSVNNELYVKQVNGATYTYAKVGGGGSGTAFIDITGLDVLPSEYQNEETLKTAILFDTDHLLRLTWIDDMYYFGNTDDFQYRYLSIDTSDWVIMRYDLQEIAKAPKVVNLNTYVPSTATNGTLDSSVLATLQASDSNYIVFNNEIFKLADKQHNEGYLVYSHNGHDTTGCFFQKCITITISTLGWVLETQENQAKLVSGTNIKTINGESILGSGNITIEGGGSGGEQTTLILTPTLDENAGTLTFTEEQLNQIATSPLEKVGKFEFDGTQYYFKIKTLIAMGNVSANAVSFVALFDSGAIYTQEESYGGVLVYTDKFVFWNDLVVNCRYNIGDTLTNTDKDFLSKFIYSGMDVLIGLMQFHNGQYFEINNSTNQITLHEISCGSDNILVDKTRIIPQISVQVNDDDTIDLTIN